MDTRPLALAVAAALVLAAPAIRADEVAAAPQAAATTPAAATKAGAARKQADCPATGSRIQRRGTQCAASGTLRSYSRQDLESTGEPDLGAALKKLDPIFH